jgi:hypothetical protein
MTMTTCHCGWSPCGCSFQPMGSVVVVSKEYERQVPHSPNYTGEQRAGFEPKPCRQSGCEKAPPANLLAECEGHAERQKPAQGNGGRNPPFPEPPLIFVRRIPVGID